MTKKMMERQSIQVTKSRAIERVICQKLVKDKEEKIESQDRRIS